MNKSLPLLFFLIYCTASSTREGGVILFTDPLKYAWTDYNTSSEDLLGTPLTAIHSLHFFSLTFMFILRPSSGSVALHYTVCLCLMHTIGINLGPVLHYMESSQEVHLSNFKHKCQILSGSSFSSVRIYWFSLSYVIICISLRLDCWLDLPCKLSRSPHYNC